jgi:hypothetical protein
MCFSSFSLSPSSSSSFSFLGFLTGTPSKKPIILSLCSFLASSLIASSLFAIAASSRLATLLMAS